MNIYHLKEKAAQVSEELEAKEIELKELLTELQSKCPHHPPNILQTPFKEGLLCDQMQLRLCSWCGLQDEGWTFDRLGVPYDRQNEIQKVSREEMFKVRRAILQTTRVGIDKE